MLRRGNISIIKNIILVGRIISKYEIKITLNNIRILRIKREGEKKRGIKIIIIRSNSIIKWILIIKIIITTII